LALLIAILLAVLVLPWPWSVLAVVGGVLVEAVELTWGLRLARRWKPRTGAEAMIGEEAQVVTACRPLGQVRVQGELWQARCEEGADVGETVRIEAIEGLTLVVRPVAAARR
jgi:membrane-bound serine protease (ClpP class)